MPGWALTLAMALIAGLTVGAAERDIPVSKVPKKVLAAAEKAVPGIRFREAEVKKTDRGILYELDGYVGEQKYEVTVTAGGKVLRVRKENEDETEEGDDSEDED